MLCVEAVSGEEFFRLSPGSKTEDVSEYLAELCLDCVELGYERLCIILDNNPTHKQKMQSQLALHLEQMGLGKSITVKYLYLPSYSPKLNLVEYVIHLARLRFLHHLPMGTTLEQIEREARWGFPSMCNHVVEQKLFQFLDSNQFLSAQQVQKTLNFIFSLVA